VADYSHSSLQKYENCPRAFKYQYIDGVKERETIEGFMGNLVHETLRYLYKELMDGRLLPFDDLIDYYRRLWDKKWKNDIKIVRGEEGLTQENYRRTGERCIREYYECYKPFNQGQTVGLELEIPIDIGGFELTGVIDRLVALRDGVYEIHDYKTSLSYPSKKKVDVDRQLALYQIGIQKLMDARRVDLVWHYLAFNKEVRSKRTSEQLEDLKQFVLSMIRQIERAKKLDFFPPKRNPLCEWCGYVDRCPAWQHELKVIQLPKNKFIVDPGVRLVDEYEEVHSKLSRLKVELKNLEKAMVARTERGRDKVLSGDSGEVQIEWEKKFPRSGEKGRSELEQLIRKNKKWKEVSNFDPRKLEGIVRRCEWPGELLNELEKYLDFKVTYRLSLVKLEEEEEEREAEVED
jgi:putative RecB family exonuclease